jgi:hypothetical protein
LLAFAFEGHAKAPFALATAILGGGIQKVDTAVDGVVNGTYGIALTDLAEFIANCCAA